MIDINEKTAELVEERKVTPTAAKNIDLEEEKKLKPEVKKLLQMFEDAGYQTHRGTNSYLLANIIVDYTQRILEERANILTYLNYWETDDLSVLAPLAFERYRIYNMRSTGTIYQAPNAGPIGQTYKGAVRISHGEFMQGSPMIVNLGNPLKLPSSLPLKIKYDQLLSGGSLVFAGNPEGYAKPDFIESFMDEDGKYIEQDYIILPDEEGQAIFYPTHHLVEKLKNSPSLQNATTARELGTLRLLVYIRKTDIIPNLTPIQDAIEVDCDYLRFITSELMAKFAILNRMSVESFVKFLKLRYNADAKIQGNQIFANLDPLKLQEVLNFAIRNVIAPVGQEWEIVRMNQYSIVVRTNNPVKTDEILEYLKLNIPRVLAMDEMHGIVDYYIDEFYRERFGFKGTKEMANDETSFQIMAGGKNDGTEDLNDSDYLDNFTGGDGSNEADESDFANEPVELFGVVEFLSIEEYEKTGY